MEQNGHRGKNEKQVKGHKGVAQRSLNFLLISKDTTTINIIFLRKHLHEEVSRSIIVWCKELFAGQNTILVNNLQSNH